MADTGSAELFSFQPHCVPHFQLPRACHSYVNFERWSKTYRHLAATSLYNTRYVHCCALATQCLCKSHQSNCSIPHNIPLESHLQFRSTACLLSALSAYTASTPTNLQYRQLTLITPPAQPPRPRLPPRLLPPRHGRHHDLRLHQSGQGYSRAKVSTNPVSPPHNRTLPKSSPTPSPYLLPHSFCPRHAHANNSTATASSRARRCGVAYTSFHYCKRRRIVI